MFNLLHQVQHLVHEGLLEANQIEILKKSSGMFESGACAAHETPKQINETHVGPWLPAEMYIRSFSVQIKMDVTITHSTVLVTRDEEERVHEL